jgi:ABC-type multidrug transport system fused ATPase/permease subunit
VDGRDIRDVRLASLLRQIGVVPQDPILFTGTVRGNIAYGRPRSSIDAVRAAARKAEIHDLIQSLPDGYESRLGPDGLKLSTGQKQQVAIARALILDPVILMLDEATASLDSHSEMLIQKALARAMHGRTCFVIAHRLSTIVNADMIVVMDEGRIVETGRHEELLEKEDGRYRALYEQQVARTRTATPIQWNEE